MEQILTAVIPVVIIGIICAAVLVIASKLMAVKEDERFPVIRECLPGANCGACGFTGCDGYAKALCGDPDTAVNLCVPGGVDVAMHLSSLLGKDYDDVEAQVAVVHCSGDCDKTQDKVDYKGIESCAAAKLLYGGKGSCSYGCLGLGDCAAACPKQAIDIIDGVARVDPAYCIGCGICARTCPNGLISLYPAGRHAIVACSNKDKGAQTRRVCTAGCIGCKKCERVCPNGAVTVTDNLAAIDITKCADCPDPGICAESCTTGCIRIAELAVREK